MFVALLLVDDCLIGNHTTPPIFISYCNLHSIFQVGLEGDITMEVPNHIVAPDGIEFRVSEMDPTQMGIYEDLHTILLACTCIA